MKLTFRKSKLRIVLVLCMIVFVIVNLILTIRLAADINKLAGPVSKRPPLPCGAIPTRFVMEEPECADMLLRSMNVTNVHILPAATYSTAWEDHKP